MADTDLHRTIREQIADRIRGEVVNGRLARGEPLREQALAERFGVSRGPIRDALLQLTHEGLLMARPNCGVKVSEAASPAVQELIIRLRREIEFLAADLLLRVPAESNVRPVAEALEPLRLACDEGRTEDVPELDMALHRALVEASGEADLVALWVPITARMMLRYSRHANLSECYAEHLAILDALRSGSRDAVRAALVANIR